MLSRSFKTVSKKLITLSKLNRNFVENIIGFHLVKLPSLTLIDKIKMKSIEERKKTMLCM